MSEDEGGPGGGRRLHRIDSAIEGIEQGAHPRHVDERSGEHELQGDAEYHWAPTNRITRQATRPANRAEDHQSQ